MHLAIKPTCSCPSQTPSHARVPCNLSNVRLSNSVKLLSLTFMLLTPSPICNAQIHVMRTNTTPDATMLVAGKSKRRISPNLIRLNRIKTRRQTRRCITLAPVLSHRSLIAQRHQHAPAPSCLAHSTLDPPPYRVQDHSHQ